MGKKICKYCLVALLVLLCVFTLSGCKKNESELSEEQIDKEIYEEPLRNYLDGLINKNVEQHLKAYPEFMKMNEKIQLSDIEDVYKEYEALYGANINMEYSLSDAIELESNDYGILISKITEAYPDAGEITIDKAFIIEVEMRISGDGIEESNQESSEENSEENKERSTSVEKQDFYVYRYNGNWYIF